MNKEFIDDLHKGICSHYVKNYGKSYSKLAKWRFNFVETTTLDEIVQAIKKYDIESIDKSTMPDAFDELVAKGYLKKLDWGFNLTEEGLEAGTRGICGSVLLFLNRNPGVSIIISAVALLISLAALCISIIKP